MLQPPINSLLIASVAIKYELYLEGMIELSQGRYGYGNTIGIFQQS